MEEIREVIKGKRTDGPISRLINRRVSNKITALIIKYEIPLTPNQVSLISFLLGVLAAFTYSLGHLIVGAILVEISSIVDGVDGELARAKKMSSPRGGFLDTMLDRLVDILIYLGLMWFAIKSGSSFSQLFLLVLFLAVTGDLLVTYFHAASELKLGFHPALIGIIPPFASRDVRLFIIFIGTLLGFITPTLLTVAVVSYSYITIKSIEMMLSS